MENWASLLKYKVTDGDMKRVFHNKVKILLYNQLKTVSSIDNLLNPFNKVIILYQWGPTIGHWTCLNKHKNGDLDFFDPYGFMPDDERKFIPAPYWQSNYLSKLLGRYHGRVYYNQYDLQSESKAVETCGRWVINRLSNSHIPLDEFIEFWHKVPKNERDKLVVEFTQPLLDASRQ